MAAKLFGVPHSLLRGQTVTPSLRADAVMSGSNKVHIQATMSRVPSPPKPASGVKAPKFHAPVMTEPAQEEPAPKEPTPEEPAFVEEPAPEEPAFVEEPAPEELAFVEEPAPEEPAFVEEPAPELKASVAMAVNLVTMELESVGESDPAADAEDAVNMQSFQVLSLKQLRTLCKHLALPTTGNKSVLTERAMGARLTQPLPAEFAFLSGWYTKTL